MAHVLDHSARLSNYPIIQVNDDNEGNKNTIIRVDHLHLRDPLAVEDYVQVTTEDQQATCFDCDHM
eukprot:8632994-Heterocapsa_arctica.AAC.1